MKVSFLSLGKGDSDVEPDFRADDMGVVVECGELRWHPEWRLVSDMQFSYDPGLPEFWCTDGHRIYFNCPASQDCRVTVSDRALNKEQACIG